MNKTDCSALRGIAILYIILHNYCHWLPGAVPENEFTFSKDYYLQFWNSLHWDSIFIHFFSFWGHLGVPVFVFLSGYGLIKKYDSVSIQRNSFVIGHYKKLCCPMIIGFLFYHVILYILSTPENYNLVDIISLRRFFAQLTLIINFLPHPNKIISPGPYWYFGMTMQLYLIYLFLVHRHSTRLIGITSLCSIVIFMFCEQHQGFILWTKYNSIGWLLPFTYGAFIARNEKILHQGHPLLITVSLTILILLSGFIYYTWLFTPLLVSLLATHLVKALNTIVTKAFSFVGKFSLYIFVLHPVIREITIPIGNTYNPYIGILVYAALTLSLSWSIFKLIQHINHCASQ